MIWSTMSLYFKPQYIICKSSTYIIFIYNRNYVFKLLFFEAHNWICVYEYSGHMNKSGILLANN